MVPLVPLVTLVLLVPTVNLDLLVLLDEQETKAHQVHQDLKEALDPLVYPAHLVLLDPLARLENVEIVERLVHRAWRALQVPEESLEHQVHKERLENQEQ